MSLISNSSTLLPLFTPSTAEREALTRVVPALPHKRVEKHLGETIKFRLAKDLPIRSTGLPGESTKGLFRGSAAHL